MHDFVGLAFDLAFKYRNPAMILADGAIGQMMEKVVLAPQRPRKTDEEIAEECKDLGYLRQRCPQGSQHHHVAGVEVGGDGEDQPALAGQIQGDGGE